MVFSPSESPAVIVREVDRTGNVPNVQTSTGAYAGKFMWGPVNKRVLVSNEDELSNVFGNPNTEHSINYHDAAYFLRYSDKLHVVRAVDEVAKNSYSTVGQTNPFNLASAPLIKNEEDFNSQLSTLDTDDITFVSRYPGELGNSLEISVCPPSGNDSAFDNWAYKNNFDGAPSTSAFATENNSMNDEIHLVVIDKDGKFSGTEGTVLETYPFVSVASNAKNTQDGSSNYVKNIINRSSNYIHLVGFDSDFTTDGNAGQAVEGVTDFLGADIEDVVNYAFENGTDTTTLTNADYIESFDLFEDKDAVEVDFLIAPSVNLRTDQVAITNDLISKAESRKDCVVITSPARSDVINITNDQTITDNIVETANDFTTSSYSIITGNFLKVYDKYNDEFVEISANSSVAGLMAEGDRVGAPWISPAGTRRGKLLGVTSINYNPNKTRRDALYRVGVNPIVNLPGSGILLFGDKTHLNRPSAFDRINVRRLFIVLERAIERAAQAVLFEQNDEFTRAEFVNIVEPVLRDVKGRRGITDFRILADETINTAEVIDRNEFRASIFIKPARSINYITLNFVAVRSGVTFEEVAGSTS